MDDEFPDLAKLATQGEARETRIIGGKARGLARLLAHGLPVPPAFVVPAGVEISSEELSIHAHALGSPLIVRSSSSIEDNSKGAAPGVFSSICDVAPADLAGAVTRVRASANTTIARDYAAALGESGLIEMAVLVQRQVCAELSGTLFTRPPGRPNDDVVVVELTDGEGWISLPRNVSRIRDETLATSSVALDATVLADLVTLALRAESAIHVGDDAANPGADIEWVYSAAKFSIVQARPIVHGHRTLTTRPAGSLFADVPREETWIHDAGHNPDPLSPAQESLVLRVEAAELAPYRMRLFAGYLYVLEQEHHEVTTTQSDLMHTFENQLRPAIEAHLARLSGVELTLDLALDVHDAVYRIYSRELAPLVRDGKKSLERWLAANENPDTAQRRAEALLPAPTNGVLGYLNAAAAGTIDFAHLVDQMGFMAPEWDVACASYGERPDVLKQLIATRREHTPHPRRAEVPLPSGSEEAAANSKLAFEIAEQDDLLYGRAHAAVRKALLSRAASLALASPTDIFFVPIGDAATCTTEHVTYSATQARREHERRRGLSMPTRICGGAPMWATESDCGVWRGRGLGGRVRGPAFRLAPGTLQRAPARSIVVCRTLTPAAALLVRDAAAIVCEHGGLLGHAAAIAREFGLPFVVGCNGLWSLVQPGDQLSVNGSEGFVFRSNHRHGLPESS